MGDIFDDSYIFFSKLIYYTCNDYKEKLSVTEYILSCYDRSINKNLNKIAKAGMPVQYG